MENTEVNLNNKRVALHTLGCRLNLSETGSIAQGFKDRGYDIVDFGEPADVVFINTCTVTDAADSTCRNLIRKAHTSSPEGKIVVAGCYAQMEPARIAGMQGVDLVLGNSEKYKVFEYLDEEKENAIHVDKSWEFYSAATTSADSHTRAFLKIQDGCNYVCSFCIIPFARGRSRAISVADAVTEAKKLVAQGFKEIVLTGVNIGEYEQASGEKLHDLVAAVLAVEGLERFRLSSVEPNTITDELLEVLKASPKVMDHFHIPLQSGDDEILKAMRRKYTVADYKRIIGKIMAAFPNAGIGADVIVGFPGETKEQFENTFNLLKELPITHFHVFPYSKRKNTTAAKMENHIHSAVKKERVKTLMMFGDAKLNLLSEDQIGKRTKVLFERRNKLGLFEGYSSNYVRVQVNTDQDLSNVEREVLVTGMLEGKLVGELLQ
ncbi:tRNA (N(6)-L-threonylcarbamoyladenosine(37)-C(2))-methylthiotransferase MtaB [Bacteriovorax stolpii]|uniref:Threonylcarbamoyladenosine tRNA methylthiotransferase MtaB n=1 Tax=Bacteriovorax stolpii TaxID=960 RepID=A0A2K9NVE9_BACTC|nr:tRNA (N(6)-L-threonylcarbamoyladenosine(37)-C(2))-methylthiotransferase MtaB [Bacteriovorax stolpii]AUN99488.1 tRNA (N(6)-L-threonylcarbamoyladenosine(37)-C(2))-methylthiotransferase MtaB [Bacteriovorax stolpii]QDK40520.1 tRNA (N(6)-L-threonylcarbamoyladenosine(37)-C(2))-methylthiotransferase MtaB [Bacteriovorax stolpii]TDP51114.1 threonylcarbamoyladenosine tRNA methylthiotransferase MtaB [Bacteriovorax stolpii]